MSLAGKDLNLLVALRALLEERNVTRAGDRLGVSQSAMSATLGRLRTHYGDDLLVRVGRDLELTPVGGLLLPQVQRTVPLIERALGAASDFDPLTAVRSFSILSSDYAALELHDRVAPLLERFRGVSFHHTTFADAPLDDRAVHTYDFVIALPGTGIDGDFASLTTDHFVCVVDQANPVTANGTLTWEEFAAGPHIVCEYESRIGGPDDHRMLERGFVLQPRVTTKGFLPIPAIVSGTDLIGLVQSRLARRMAAATHTVAVPTPFPRAEVVELLWWHPHRLHDDAHRWARDFILSAFGNDDPETAPV